MIAVARSVAGPAVAPAEPLTRDLDSVAVEVAAAVMIQVWTNLAPLAEKTPLVPLQTDSFCWC